MSILAFCGNNTKWYTRPKCNIQWSMALKKYTRPVSNKTHRPFSWRSIHNRVSSSLSRHCSMWQTIQTLTLRKMAIAGVTRPPNWSFARNWRWFFLPRRRFLLGWFHWWWPCKPWPHCRWPWQQNQQQWKSCSWWDPGTVCTRYRCQYVCTVWHQRRHKWRKVDNVWCGHLNRCNCFDTLWIRRRIRFDRFHRCLCLDGRACICRAHRFLGRRLWVWGNVRLFVSVGVVVVVRGVGAIN